MTGNKNEEAELICHGHAEPTLMDTDNGEPGAAEAALNRAKSAVDSAGAHVEEVSHRLTEAVEKAKRPETYVELLKGATVAAPLGMLVTAFIAGAIFGSSRRR